MLPHDDLACTESQRRGASKAKGVEVLASALWRNGQEAKRYPRSSGWLMGQVVHARQLVRPLVDQIRRPLLRRPRVRRGVVRLCRRRTDGDTPLDVWSKTKRTLVFNPAPELSGASPDRLELKTQKVTAVADYGDALSPPDHAGG